MLRQFAAPRASILTVGTLVKRRRLTAPIPVFEILSVNDSDWNRGKYQEYPPLPPLTAEAFCAQLPGIGFGNYFYCGTSQANLQTVNFPDGSRGYCMPANENLGLVGYSATTYNGGATPVMSQSNASDASRLLGSQSPGYIRCTRQ